MSNSFIFKTSKPELTFIGYNANPNPTGIYANDVMTGIHYTGLPAPAPIVCKGLPDENGNKIVIVDDPKSAIMDLRGFHENYKQYTSNVKLVMSAENNGKFSPAVRKVIDQYMSGCSTGPSTAKKTAKKTSTKTAKKSTKKPAKKSTKKTSKKTTVTGGGKKKSGKKKSGKKKSGKKKSGKKKSGKKKSGKKKSGKKKAV